MGTGSWAHPSPRPVHGAWAPRPAGLELTVNDLPGVRALHDRTGAAPGPWWLLVPA